MFSLPKFGLASVSLWEMFSFLLVMGKGGGEKISGVIIGLNLWITLWRYCFCLLLALLLFSFFALF